MGTIWLNISIIYNWNRPAVGIVRVEAECARHALNHLKSQVRFCRYDTRLGFLEVDRNTVHLVLSALDDASPPLPPQKNLFPVRPAPETRLANYTKRFINKLPPKFGSKIFQYLSIRREAANAGINGLREFRRAFHLWFKPPFTPHRSPVPVTPQGKTCCIKKEDVYLSLGLNWDYAYLEFLAECKHMVRFKILLCCHDVIPIKFPHLCINNFASQFASYLANAAWCADEVLCVSKHTENDYLELLNELGAPLPHTTVFTPGSNLPVQQAQGEQEQFVSPQLKQFEKESFVLFVSTIERRKNHETLYRAYTRLVEKGYTQLPKLIFVGMRGWGITDFIADIELDPRITGLIHILTNVTDAELSWLYQRCLFTVFPSLYEGWGLAVAESLAFGKFCLASNIASIPEVGGDFIEYLDPWDVPKWTERLEFYFNNPKALTAVEEHIKKEYLQPTWENAAKTIFTRAELFLDNPSEDQF